MYGSGVSFHARVSEDEFNTFHMSTSHVWRHGCVNHTCDAECDVKFIFMRMAMITGHDDMATKCQPTFLFDSAASLVELSPHYANRLRC